MVNIEEYIMSILWGKHIISLCDNNRTLCFRSPTIAEKNHADFIYQSSLKLYKAAGILTNEQLLKVATNQNEWTEIDNNYYKNFDSLMDLANEQLVGASKSQQKRLKRQIKQAKKKRLDVVDRYYSITCNSVEQQAMEDKVKYYIQNLTENMDGTPIWQTMEEFQDCMDHTFIAELVTHYFEVVQKFLSTKIIRQIARSSAWRIRWNIGKKNVYTLFGADIRDLNDNQLELLYWSQVYDNVFDSAEPPSESIVEDDDKLDAWLKEKHKEHTAKRVNRSMEKKGKRGFYDKSGEFHSMGKQVHEHKEIGVCLDGYFDEETGYFIHYTKEEKMAKLDEIYGRNDPSTRSILASEQRAIEGKSVVREEHLRKGRNRLLLTLSGKK